MVVLDSIFSEDVTTYLKKINKQFTDFEQAALIYNSQRTIAEIISELEKLLKKTKDLALATQIKQRLEYEQAAYEAFSKSSDNALYKLDIYEKEDGEYTPNGYFTTLKAATDFANHSKRRYFIEKVRVFKEGEKVKENFGYVEDFLGDARFEADGKLRCYSSTEVDKKQYLDDYDYSRFEYSYVFVPHPFRTGQIVRIRGTDALGVVEEPTTDEKMYENEVRRKKSGLGDHTDIVVGVEFLEDDGDFVCDTIELRTLEYANLKENHPARELLEEAGKMLRGETSIQNFLKVQREYREK